ncbi:MAG: hypothetical protein D3922_02905, partial [Candidatus Electrothrix sp. AR1]|nr:hypothetical protein [Candidatus Electrothrix sp. AR1]
EDVRHKGLAPASTAPVGSYPANDFGLHDMLGNVWEWCADRYKEDYYSSSRQNNPTGPASGSDRVIRGGGWDLESRIVRAAFRAKQSPDNSLGDNVGFRLVLSKQLSQKPFVVTPRQPIENSSKKGETPSREIAKKTVDADMFKQGDIITDKTTGMEFVSIPGGDFLMGSPDHEVGRSLDEGPVDKVRVESFWMGKYEVTQGQWVKIMGSNPSEFQNGEDYPMEKVSWDEVQEFIVELNKQSKQSGREYRLPTEAEWEYAARAETTTARYWGDDISCDRAMYGNHIAFNSCVEYTRSGEAPAKLTAYSTAPVGSYPPNQFGLHDMLGNVAEFCSNWYVSYKPSRRHRDSKNRRVVRGGDWRSQDRKIRSADRDKLSPQSSNDDVGFRLVFSVQRNKNFPAIEPREVNEKTPVAPVAKPELPLRSGKAIIDSVIGMEFVSVPGGCFQMGSLENERDRDNDEGPVHKVCVNSFQMGKYEVTQGQWKKIMGSNPSEFQKGDSYPVEKVSWDDAQEFIGKLNAKSGKNYRLPTEAEWEYACRANDSGKYCGGDDVDALGWHKKNSGNRSTRPVGGKQANKFGLYDMSGNVWEWCADWSGENYYNSSPQDNPTGPSSGLHRVFRGGTWQHIPKVMRAANRGGAAPDGSNDDLGFRLVLPIQ